MTYISLILSEEAAPACIRELGVLGCFQFIDLNPELTPFQRRYVAQIKRCEEIERKIRYVHGETKRMNIPVQQVGSIEQFVESSVEGDAANGAYLLDTLESKLDVFEQQLVELNKFSSKLTTEYAQKVEYHHLLVKARKFLGAHADIENYDEVQKAMGNKSLSAKKSGAQLLVEERGAFQDDMTFSNVAGVLPTADKVRFERMLFRATRGNCYVRFSPLSSKALDAEEKPIDKVAFIIFYKSTAIEGKIKRICDAFSANRYDLRNLNRPSELDIQQQQNHQEMTDAKVVLDKNTETRNRLCYELALHVEEWLWVVRREKSIYHTLNLFKNDVASNLLRGRAWILSNKVGEAKSVIRRAYIGLNLTPLALLEKVPEKSPTPPTHFETNKFTYAFQEFVNTYGIPRYKEINPALFTAATFPFLFGVMYGDIGHGSILALAGLYLVLTESRATSRATSESMKELYTARYMLLMMGTFGVYCGLIYNDYFSLGLNLFGSSWNYEVREDEAEAVNIGAYGDPAHVYPFGVDPAWKIAKNELLFYNSMKMKMSVILGITQMCFGVTLRGVNAIYFKSYLDFVGEFVPMIIFALSFFGYMVILIFIKWSIDWDNRMALGSCGYNQAGIHGACNLQTSPFCYDYNSVKCDATTLVQDMCPLDYGGTGDGCQPPNLITTLINIALQPGSVDEPMYAGQGNTQTVLLLIAFICVPWLLLAKPMYIWCTTKPAHHHVSTEHHGAENPLLRPDDLDKAHSNPHGSAGDSHGEEAHEEHNFTEIVIHQCIETIEFVLGMVSNTASYLRLWALSLAHTELATVFWDKAMVSMISTNNPVLIFAGYAVFASVTFAVLLAMDVLECFLHALRLHWVEFQNKFYKADGYRFTPFEFKAVISRATFE